MKAVTAENLVKTYNKGTVKALDGLNLDVEEGTVLGVLGPNGFLDGCTQITIESSTYILLT